MARSLKSLLPFNSKLHSGKHVSVSSPSISTPKIHSTQRSRRWAVSLSVGNNDESATEAPKSSVSDSTDDASSNGSAVKQSMKKRSKARERLKAARVLNRYNNDAKAAAKNSVMGSNVLDAIRQSDGKKRRSGLPEAPTNLFDDSKRGLPKPGWTFQFPGGSDLFLIAVSFVLISTIMFTTTFIVWKVGAIHFNEY